MIQRPGWSPFGRPEPEDEPAGGDSAEIESDTEADLEAPSSGYVPLEGGAVEHQHHERPKVRLGPGDSYEELKDPNGPLKAVRDAQGRLMPGTSASPATIWTPETAPTNHTKRAPFSKNELDWAIADRLRERLDAPEPEAIDRITLLARRMVDDALRGRTKVQELLLGRLQPPVERAGAAGGGGGIVVVTQVVGPQGAEMGVQTFDLPTGFEDEDDA